MKIIQIITQMEAGGAQRMMHLLGRELMQGGHTVETWFLYQKRPAYVGMPGVRVVLDRCPSGTDYLTIILRLARMLRTEKPDVLITHTYYSNIIGQCIGRACRINRGIAVQHSPLNTFPFAARFLDWLVGTLGIYAVNVAVSDGVLRSAARYPSNYRRRVLRIYNGVPKPIPSGTPEEIRTRWNLPLSKPLLIHVGRFSRQKNQPFLLDVIARLPETHLVLVGDGELRDELMTQIQQRHLQDRVDYMGEVSPETVHDLVSASDVFVFPSRFEAMSMVLLETMHLGIPIVASDIPANRDLLQSSAILLPIDGPERWVTEIGSLLGCRDSAAELGEKERSRVQRFTTDAMAASYRQLLI
jgi:glycosyltransferase involved in cell wall biosynthesis